MWRARTACARSSESCRERSKGALAVLRAGPKRPPACSTREKGAVCATKRVIQATSQHVDVASGVVPGEESASGNELLLPPLLEKNKLF